MNKLEQFCIERELSKSTRYLYNSCVKAYEEINVSINDSNKFISFDSLIEEAEAEEEAGIRWKKRKLKERLIHFRRVLFSSKSEGTANRYLSCIQTIYRHYEIELLDLPTFKSKQIDKTYKMDYEDIITKSEIIDGYYEAPNVVKCIILLAISSGLSKVDMLNLTVDDFITACDDYLSSDDLVSQLKELKEQDDVIPCFRGERQKTTTKFITFCSPEAVEHIVQYLLGRDSEIKYKYELADDEDKEYLTEELLGSDKLFDVTAEHISYVFRKINKKLELGLVGKFAKYRCHMLRKYHASTLLNSEILTWTVEEIDTLQGRSMDMTHQAYFKNSKEKLFKKYCACVDELMLFKSIHQISQESFDKLESENRFYKKELIKNEQKLEEQQETIDKIINNQKELKMMLELANG